MDETREQKRISDEEDRSVVADQIPVALFRVEFDGETAWITRRIRRPRFTADRREPYEQRCPLADMRE